MEVTVKGKSAAKEAYDAARRRGLLAHNGMRVEEAVRNLFGLRKSAHNFGPKPDVFDPEKGAIGEIKSFRAGSRALVYVNQLERYLQLKDEINTTATLDGSKSRVEVFLFAAVCTSAMEITDIYRVCQRDLQLMLERKKQNNSEWNIVDPKILRELEAVKRDSQLSKTKAAREELRKRILGRNKRGTYIRLTQRELDAYCPRISVEHSTNYIRVHEA